MYFIFENEAGIVGGGYAAYNEMREILREKRKNNPEKKYFYQKMKV